MKRKPEQSTLLENLRARSKDIDEKTSFWSAEVAKLETLKREKQVPGSHLVTQVRNISPIQGSYFIF